MAEYVKQVRTIGELQDFDGVALTVGVDYDLITIRGDARLDSRAAAELHALWVAATVAVDQYKATHGDDDDD